MITLLKVSQLCKSYNDIVVVKDFSLHIKQGEAYGLLGPNGAGKSTTISMICGLIKPTSGEILIKGVDLLKKTKLAQQSIGVVPQEIALYLEMTAKENLMFWGRMYGLKGALLKKRVNDVLEIIGLTDRAGDKVNTFSGGMKRRVNIGAAILHKPDLLIMDEPTVGIDPQSRNHILETVKKLNSEGMTIIYTSHYMEEVEFLCNRIGIMDHGKLLAEGTIEELQQLVGNQTELNISLQEDVAEPEKLQKVLQEHFNDQAFYIKQAGIQTFSSEPQSLLVKLLPLLSEEKYQVVSIQIIEPNLENVFLHLTGRKLRN